MPPENPFRIALVVVIILTMAVTLYHRLQAAASGEKISRKDEGYLFATVLRLAGLCLWIATFAYLISPPLVQWATVPLHPSVRWVGVAVGVGCSVLMYWTLSSLGKNRHCGHESQCDPSNTRPLSLGPAPFYVTAALLMASVTLLTANWLIGASCLLVLGLLAIRTPKEEQMLIERFGQQYQEYMAKTGRFFPRLPTSREP